LHDKDTRLHENKRRTKEKIIEAAEFVKIGDVTNDICYQTEQIGVGL
jgi:hypothetical protein